MPDYSLTTPWGTPDLNEVGTSPEDMQRIIASKYEFRTDGSAKRGGILRHDGLSRDGNGVELRPDATVRVHEGAVLLDVGALRCVEAAVPYNADVSIGLAPGTAGTVYIYVTPPQGTASNKAILSGTTSAPPANAVELERLSFKAGWTATNQATRILDKQYAVPAGTANGQMSAALDSNTTARKTGQTYKTLAQSFVAPTDCNISLSLSTTIRACNSAGTAAVALSTGLVAAVNYRVYLDGALLTSFERPISGYTDTVSHEFIATIGAGRHQVWVESGLGAVGVGTRASTYWQVMQGGSMKHRGDYLRVRHEGARW